MAPSYPLHPVQLAFLISLQSVAYIYQQVREACQLRQLPHLDI